MNHAPRTIWDRAAADDGSAGISTFFAVIVMIMLLGVGIGGMRTMIGQGDVTAAARAGARAAAIEHRHGDAVAAAEQVVNDEIARSGLACATHSTSVDTPAADFQPGGIVTVTVSCSVEFTGLFAPWSTGPKVLTGTSAEPIDCIRGGANDEVVCGGFP
jgi:Flp pilus assembly protein TadG